MSIKSECIFVFLNFLIIGLCNSSANSLFEIFSFYIADLFRVARGSKVLQTKEAILRWYASHFGFLVILNGLSCKTLSAAVLLFKSLKHL